MIPRFQYPQFKVSADPKIQILPAVAAVLNAILGLLVMFLLILRLIALMQDFSKFTIMDIFFTGGGLILSAVKVALAIVCTIVALTATLPIQFATIQLAGYVSTGINTILFILYLVLMITLGTKDPKDLTFNLFLVATIVAFLEALTAALYVMLLEDPTPKPPMGFPYGYMPVLQSANQPQMIPMQNF